MKLNELETGYVLILRDGRRRVVIRSGNVLEFLHPEGQGSGRWSIKMGGKLNPFDDNLNHKNHNNCDIVSVYDMPKGGGNLILQTGMLGELLWTRKETKQEILSNFCTAILKQKDCPVEFKEIVDNKFWELID